MKVRTVEIPLCDKCQRDGEILTVIDPSGDNFTLVRCRARHIEALRRESDDTLADEAVTKRPTPSQGAVLDYVRQKGRPVTAGELATHFEVAPQAIGRVMSKLVLRGQLSGEKVKGRATYRVA